MIDLQQLRADYLRSGEKIHLDEKHGEWDESVIHISELGDCPRKIMLRLSGAEKKYVPQGVRNNMELMWWLGYRLHYLTYEALEWAGMLIGYELPVTTKEGFSGRLDCKFKYEGETYKYDAKSVRSNAFRFDDFPKIEHVTQIGGYCLDEFHKTDHTIIEYIDRGGSHTPVISEVDETHGKSLAMDATWILEDARSRLPELPNPLGAELKEHRRRDANRTLFQLSMARPWKCDYCDYDGVSCDSFKDERVVATEKNGRWTFDGKYVDWTTSELERKTGVIIGVDSLWEA